MAAIPLCAQTADAGVAVTDVTVLTEGDRIAAIGSDVAIPRRRDAGQWKGKFLIPGLWDGAECLDLFAAKGVLGTRDMGAMPILFCRCETASGQARCSVRWWRGPNSSALSKSIGGA